ncbi:MAG: adenosylcobinamide-phosphate synthase CbiB [Ornithinimicrobium sp.]
MRRHTLSRCSRRAGGAALGLLLDRAFAEPPTRWHPVAWFGTAMGHLEQRVWADGRGAGVGYAIAGLTLGASAGTAIGFTAPAVALCVAGDELRRVSRSIQERLSAGDLDGARALLPSLVGRDPSTLDASGIAAAVVESLAENSVDAVIAPLCWAALAGAPGAAAYRAVNTMDAMVGHRNDRYEHFGWAAARTDDIANYVPARVFALLVAMAQPHRALAVWTAARRDAPAHPSPNAGIAEASVAAALGVELGGPLRYGARIENRPRLGEGRRPVDSDIDAAIRLTSRVEWLVTGLLTLAWWSQAHRRSRARRYRHRVRTLSSPYDDDRGAVRSHRSPSGGGGMPVS